MSVPLKDLNEIFRKILGEEWDDITPEEVEQKKQDIRAQAPYPWCIGNPTIQDCIHAGYCRRNPNCGEQMPRAHSKDERATELLRENGFFSDRASFVGYDLDRTPHLLLEGEDKARIRLLVFKKHKYCCVVCKHRLHPDAPNYDQLRGDWHHPKACDCVGCSELRCNTTTGRKCHAHRTSGFKRVAEESNERTAK